MKKLFSVLIPFLIIFSLFSGCGDGENYEDDGKLDIVATIFPAYDWTKEIIDGCEGIDLTMLLDSGIDMHSYQPSADDIIKISSCDMFIYVGGESDNWVEGALSEAVNKNMVVINMLEVLGENVREEEPLPGIDHNHDEHGEDEDQYDEHVWLSLKNAEIICGHISEKLSEIAPENSEKFSENLSVYIEKLSTLDEKYQSVVDSSPVKTLVFGDRFPFRYLTEDYGIDYYAAFEGCSAETEASFETITFLASQVDSLNIKSVIIIDGSDGRIAETIIASTKNKNQEILSLDSMQSVSSADISDGATYISFMEKNLDVLSKALK